MSHAGKCGIREHPVAISLISILPSEQCICLGSGKFAKRVRVDINGQWVSYIHTYACEFHTGLLPSGYKHLPITSTFTSVSASTCEIASKFCQSQRKIYYP